MKKPFIWDRYSDQPYPLKDKIYKKKMRKNHQWDYFSLFFISLIFFPLGVILFLGKNLIEYIINLFVSLSCNKVNQNNFYGMGVDIDKGSIQNELIDELGVKYLLIRMPLWEMKRVDKYVAFAKSFGEDKEILINILQDREHIEDVDLLKQDIKIIFEKFSPFVREFQIGNAINRTKWGFFSMKEYLSWYQIIQKIRDESYPTIKLIGSSVIDFEFHYTIRTLFNFFSIKYDKFSSLLYVDRRGSPTTTQMGIFDTKNKIDMLYTLVKLSPKTNNEIYITEANWPLKNTTPYAPTSEKECVSEEEYSKFMVEYHQIAWLTDRIERVYWHQLIASGYGLIDERDGLRKREAFYAYKKMIH